MKYKLKRIVILVCHCFVIVLAGCASGQAHVIVNKDGSADTNLTFRLSNEAKMYIGNFNPFSSIEEVLKQNGFTMQPFESNDQFGFNATKHLDSTEFTHGEANTIQVALTKSMNSDIFSYNTTQQESFFYTTYKVTGKLNVSPYYKDLLQTMGKQFKVAQVAPSFVASQLKQNIDLYIKISLPVKAVSSNATHESSDGKELEWKIDPTTENIVSMVVNVPNIKHIVIVGSMVLVLLIVLLIFVIKWRSAVTKQP